MCLLQRLIYISCFFFIFHFNSVAQNESNSLNKNFEFGLEIQAYPTGIIPGIRLEKFINSVSSFNLRLGFQIIDHRDLGVKDDEAGSGYGASLAYRRFFSEDHKGLSLAFRTDFWRNKIEWQNDSDKGISNISVVQPTLMGEYCLRPNPHFSITPSLSFGWEWNVSSDGEPTGEGAIILLGCTFGFEL